MKTHDLAALGVSALYILAVVLIGMRSRPRTELARDRLPQTWKPWSDNDAR